MTINEKDYPWITTIKPVIRQMIREEMGHSNPKVETIQELIKEEVIKEQPARHNHMWSRKERINLLNEINWYPLKFIAIKHERTLGAIICQLKREWEEGNI